MLAFWLASPLMDPPTLFITAGALGWHFAIGKAAAAVGPGLPGGHVMAALMRAGAFAQPLRPTAPASCGRARPALDGKPVWRVWRDPARRATFCDQGRANALFLIKWMALAYLLEGLMIVYLPAEAVGGLVAALIQQGMSPGAATAFLAAGALSSAPAMAAVWSLVRPPVFAMYFGLGLGGAMLAGALFSLVA